MSLDEKLFQFIKDAKDWERMATSVSGVFLLKLPSYKVRSASVVLKLIQLTPLAQLLKREA